MQIQRKVVPVGGFKVIDAENGIVEAFVSVTGVVDEVKDVIEVGAYEKTLLARNPKGCWSHDWDTPVSKTLAAEEVLPGDGRLPTQTRTGEAWPEEAGALLVKMQFNLKTQRGREAFEDVTFFEDEQEWSIGYNVPVGGAKMDPKTGIRHINTIELFEYSPVLFGAMPLTVTASIKSAQEAYRKEAIKPHDFRGDEGSKCEVCDENYDSEFHYGSPTYEEAHKDDEAVVEGDEKWVALTADELRAFEGLTKAEDGEVTTPADPQPQVPVEGASTGEAEPEARPEVEGAAGDASVTPAAGEESARSPEPGAAEKVVIVEPDVIRVLADVSPEVAEIARTIAKTLGRRIVFEGKVYMPITGSYEARQQALYSLLEDWEPADELLEEQFTGGGDEGPALEWDPYWGEWYEPIDSWTYVEATFDDRVIIAYEDYDAEPGEPRCRFFQAGYTFDEAARTAVLTEDPVEITVTTAIAVKALERAKARRAAGSRGPRRAKEGRVLSGSNAEQLVQVVSSILSVLDGAGVSHPWSDGAPDATGDTGAGVETPANVTIVPGDTNTDSIAKSGSVILSADEIAQFKALSEAQTSR